MDDNLLDWMELPQSGNIGKHVSFHVVLVQILLRSSIYPFLFHEIPNYTVLGYLSTPVMKTNARFGLIKIHKNE